MPHEQRENSGIAFRNDRKREGKQDAEWTGSINVAGKLYWLNIWEKEGQKGPFLTASVRPKTAAPNSVQEPTARANPAPASTDAPWEDSSGVPF